MKNFCFILGIMLGIGSTICLADQFVPEFDKMQILRCDYQQTMYNQDGSTVSTSNQHRLYRIDDAYKKIYNQKEPIDNVMNFDTNRIEFTSQSMNDDYIAREHTLIDRNEGTFSSESQITYDNEMFSNRYSRSLGTCEVLE